MTASGCGSGLPANQVQAFGSCGEEKPCCQEPLWRASAAAPRRNEVSREPARNRLVDVQFNHALAARSSSAVFSMSVFRSCWSFSRILLADKPRCCPETLDKYLFESCPHAA